MLPTIHTALQRLLYERGQISPREVDITFEAPTRERVDRLTHPTINLFLLDIQENLDLRQNNFQTRQHNGRVERRQVPRRFDVRYMITILTTNVEDEHLLLWRVLATLLQHPQIPEDVLPEKLHALDPPLTSRIVPFDEGQTQLSIWTALGVPPHPVLHYVVTVPMEIEQVTEAPLVLTRTFRYSSKGLPEAGSQVRNVIGGTVRDGEGRPVKKVVVTIEGNVGPESTTNQEGRFVLSNVPSGSVTLRAVPEERTPQSVVIHVPGDDLGAHTNEERATAYDIILETASSTEV